MLEALASAIAARGDPSKLPAEYGYEEVAVAAGGLEEGAIGVPGIGLAREHLGHKIEHRVDLALMRVDLSQVANALAGFDL